jgi:Sec-independent protein translocase protein TatA
VPFGLSMAEIFVVLLVALLVVLKEKHGEEA